MEARRVNADKYLMVPGERLVDVPEPRTSTEPYVSWTIAFIFSAQAVLPVTAHPPLATLLRHGALLLR
jgi:hypothetical protein